MSEAPRKVVPGDRGDFALWHDAVDDVAVWFVGRAPTIEDGLEAAALPRELPRAFLRQIHSSAVLEARDGAHGDLGEGDALVSSARDLVLEIRTADCVPVLVAAGGRIAAIHAGWRGIVSGVVANAVARLSGPPVARENRVAAIGARRATAWIGPAIGACCYEVGDDVAAAVVAAARRDVSRPGPRGRPHLDLAAAVAAQLAAAGVEEIRSLGVCTRCHPEWLASHRRDGAGAGRNRAWILRRRSGTAGL